MTRHTVRLVEVATPVYDAHAKDKIRHIFDTIMTDDEKGKELCADGEYVDRKINSTPIDTKMPIRVQTISKMRQLHKDMEYILSLLEER